MKNDTLILKDLILIMPKPGMKCQINLTFVRLVRNLEAKSGNPVTGKIDLY